ncbi:ACP S-malonyltransferase [Acanthopleuribacter pedis]|uniref:[acyl-carrier-protein] S-malonyltransferase n=1 Tax=Acanthopleuribacter pedis TaxID=442870 RepID=A0A8J7QLM1_9BACT|nr:ACP S-malonyltransferase [Acanthopleuribacter pedis]MBO1322040.1 ACP S-malonyltransferase [Acanthopleuribacter pedis]
MFACLFPGQGSQKKGMGKDLFGQFQEITAKADRILGYSIEALCLENPDNRLVLTQFTQPALYVVNALTWMKAARDEPEARPAFVAGHSLGEYNALFAAGVFDFETGLRLVRKRGELMGRAKDGGMAAVVGLPEAKIRAVLADADAGAVDPANFNAPHQTVISGPLEILTALKQPFMDAGARTYLVLKVSAAFHSRYMAPAGREFAEFLEGFTFHEPRFPVIANVTARPYQPDQISANLAAQITGAVKWSETICYLRGKGVTDFRECGPGRVLTNLNKRIMEEAEPLYVADEPTMTSVEPTMTSVEPTMTSVEPTMTSVEPTMTSEPTKTPEPTKTSVPPASPVPAPSQGAVTACAVDTMLASIKAETLGAADFRERYGVRYAYVAGAMYKGIASKELVVRMGQAGLIGFLGTGGLKMDRIEEDLRFISGQLSTEQSFGMNLLSQPDSPETEMKTVDLFLKYGVRNVEAAAYIVMSPALVYYRLKGAYRNAAGKVRAPHNIIAKVSRPEVAENFLSPAPEKIVRQLVAAGRLTEEEAALGRTLPMSADLCVEADSGGHTDMGVAAVLIPTIRRLRDRLAQQFGHDEHIHVGSAGGIGTPEAAASAFMLGADFILTGSINQPSPESGASDAVKDLLQQINVQDTEYAPAGDMFELGAKVQVVRRGLFFPARANKLYDLYRNHNSLDELDAKTRHMIQEKYFRRSFDDVWQETRAHFLKTRPQVVEKAERNPKFKMALIFKWYFVYSTRLAMSGDMKRKVDFQIHCGPALGAFNQWVKGTDLEPWTQRNVDRIADHLMNATAEYLRTRMTDLLGPAGRPSPQ